MATSACLIYSVAVAFLSISSFETNFSVSAAALRQVYSNRVYLDPNREFLLQWTVNQEKTHVDISLVVNTTGWIGFGISRGLTGNMNGADMVMGYVSADGMGYLEDRYSTKEELPMKDSSQDCTLTAYGESNGQTTLQFTRKLNTCDKEDNPILDSTTKVIYAYHSEDPAPGDKNSYKRHQKRGAKSLHFMTNMFDVKRDPGTKSFILGAKNVSIPTTHTTYWCIFFPNLRKKFGEKKNVIEVSPEIQKGNEAYVHHATIWRCPRALGSSIGEFSGECFARDTPREVRECSGSSIVYGYGVGGSSLMFPSHVSLPIAESDESYVLQMHYDNPYSAKGVVDNSGFRFYYADEPRKYEAGIFRLGLTFRNSILVPPKQPSWPIHGYCTPGCIQEKNASAPFGGKIKVFAAYFHQHLSGKGGWSKLLRKGKEIREISREDNFDFDSAVVNLLKDEIEFGPEDEFITSCKFGTSDRDVATQGGFSTRDEMCSNNFLYYPKKKFNQCTSKTLDLTPFSKKYAKVVDTSKNFILNPFDWSNVTWTDEMVKELRSIYDRKNTTVQCTNFDAMTAKNAKLWNITKPVISYPLPLPADPCLNAPSTARPTGASTWLVVGIMLFATIFLRICNV